MAEKGRRPDPLPACRIELKVTGITERVILEMERLLQRKLTPAEVRLLLLAGVVEEKILEDEMPADIHERDAA